MLVARTVDELLAARAVPARVRRSVQIARGAARAPDRLDRGRVTGVGAGTDEVVVGDVERVREHLRTAPRCASTNAATSTPASAAACAFFGAFSSVPVRNRTGCPRSRACRAMASVCTSSSACPRCGAALTNGMAVVR